MRPAAARPLSADALGRRALPFLAIFALAFAALLLPDTQLHGAWLAAAAGLTVALVAAGALVPWQRLPAWSEAAVPLGFLAVVFLLREAGGGATSGYSQIAVLPVVWLAMYGTRRQALAAAAGLTLVFLLPIFALGYPTDELRRVLLWASLAPMVALTINNLVARLKTSEHRHEAIMAEVGEVVFEVDLEGRWTALSPAYEQFTGYPNERALGHAWHELTHPDDIAPTYADFAGLAGGEVEIVTRDNRVYVADGSERWVAFTARARRDAAGTVIGFAGTMRDVTDRKRLEQELEADRAFSRAVLNQLGDRVVVADPEGNLQVFRGNPFGTNERVRGLHPDRWVETYDIRSRTTGEPIDPRDVPMARALQGETVPDTELLFGSRHMLIGASPIRGEGGERLGAVASMLDITTLREAEQRAGEYAADLETVGRVAHQLAGEHDLDGVRATICAAAAEATGASLAVLFEPDADQTELRATGTAGMGGDVRPRVALTGAPSGTATAFLLGETLFEGELATAQNVDRALIDDLGLRAAIWHPVRHDGRSVGVLAVGWDAPRGELGDRTHRLIDLLANEAALAIDRARLIEELEATAGTDALTQIANRRTWDERLPEELARARRTGDPLCVAILDLDRFKLFNDGRGHQAGDLLLRDAAAAWKAELRTSDVLARYGGEEFAVLLPACGVPAALDVLERLRRVVPHGQTASVGVALWDGTESADQLVSRADAALYQAKRDGRDRILEASAPPPPETAAVAATQVLRTARRIIGMDVAFLSELRDGRLVIRDLDGDPAPHGYVVGEGGQASGSYCARVMDGRLPHGVVADARAHPVTRVLPSTEAEAIGAYIGAPIRTSDGRWLGMLCGVSREATPGLGAEDEALLGDLAKVVADDLERELAAGAEAADAVATAWSRTLGTLGTPLP